MPSQRVPGPPPAERERLAEAIADRLDPLMTWLGVVFLLVVLAEPLPEPGSALALALQAAGWLIWGAFVLEFLARLWVAPSVPRFLRRNWWQALFLVVPFLRFLRLVRTLRLARTGRVVSSAVRATRTARARLTSRVGWLSAVTAVVILASGQLLHELGEFPGYGAALHASALASVAGQPVGASTPLGQVIEVALALYSVVVFASLAGILGAYFLERPDRA